VQSKHKVETVVIQILDNNDIRYFINYNKKSKRIKTAYSILGANHYCNLAMALDDINYLNAIGRKFKVCYALTSLYEVK
jgi:hypothetical protein